MLDIYSQLRNVDKLRYLRVSSRIPERYFHDSAQNNGVEQHIEQSRKPYSLCNGTLKKA